jgi:hypothetical protein
LPRVAGPATIAREKLPLPYGEMALSKRWIVVLVAVVVCVLLAPVALVALGVALWLYIDYLGK